MWLDESIACFNSLQPSICEDDMLAISDICKALHLPQKTLAISNHIFFAAKAESKIEPDDVVLISSVINLACKICETLRPLEKIMHLASKHYSIEIDQSIMELYTTSINKTEIELSVVLDFNFEISEIYTRLERLCKEKQFDSVFSRRCWIMLNDIMQTPLSIYFTIDELLTCTIFTNYVASELKNEKTMDDVEMYEIFSEKYKLTTASFSCIEFMSNKLLELYSTSN
ncbi:uncharacterized protein VICG_00152 [Vittaforma corneae ATCC 50505]|uniref:Cyclin N-terminal domain-containing protein n=1 Tax=Vittaforma corneae (strain ATCC 50505) TaxID=993615 RepID=L2GR82_VITCO|nr:uncharacterized protein VICG_00152 [Vittaforma corneae ATCC 50505]ELA42837.1 hypothetical protein VICG_00152 [Vittaforma corneae ATCC 50505]